MRYLLVVRPELGLKFFESTGSWEWPENAAEILEPLMLDAKAKLADRIRAAQFLGEATVASEKVVNFWSFLPVRTSASAPMKPMRIALFWNILSLRI